MKKLKILSMLMFVALTSIMFVACGDDDDGGDGNNSALVGSWKYDFNGGYLVATFKSDNTGILKEYSNYSGMMGDEKFRYSYNASDKHLRIVFEDGDVNDYTVISVTSNSLKVLDLDDESVLTFTKYTGGGSNDDDDVISGGNTDVKASALIGKWRMEDPKGYHEITILKDGTGNWRQYNNYDGSINNDKFYWTFDEKTKKLTFTFVDAESYESEWYTVIGIYGNYIVLTDEDGEEVICTKI